MPQTRKPAPLRFWRRNRAYLIAALLVVLLAVSAVLVVRQVRALSGKQNEPDTQPAQAVQKPETPENDADTPAGPETPAQPGVYTPPFEGTTVLLADGGLVMTYDDAALTRSGADGLVSLTAEGQTARLDVQELSGDLSRFTRAELERICKGVLQAYYFAAPATDDITLSDAQQTEDNFSAVLRAEAYEDAPAVTALVQLRQLNGKSWCVSAILPDGENTDAIRQAMDSVEPLPEGVTVEGAVQP